MSDNYQPIRILKINKTNEYFISHQYGYSGYGIYQYIKAQFNEAKEADTHLIIGITFIQVMQSAKGFDMAIFYDMLFARDYFKISDPDDMQNVLYKMIINNTKNFPEWFHTLEA